MKIKAALIVDNMSIAGWQRQALDEITDLVDVRLVLNCRNTRTKKRFAKHFLYYAVNVLWLRSALTRSVPVEPGDAAQVVSFDSDYEGMWQRLPADMVEQIRRHDIRLVIKFGMSLLRVGPDIEDLDILSYHHGDPEHYRGRPAGFYEILDHADKVGIIVQRISNTLDGGEILARAHSKIYHHSYRRTAANFYANSRYLLRKAILNYQDGTRIELGRLGPNYRLPSNSLVARFILKLAGRSLCRLAYGAFWEKRWNIVTLKMDGIPGTLPLSVASGKVPDIGPRYSFYADPFFSMDGKKIRVEALNAKNGLGEIIEVDVEGMNTEAVLLKGSHYSYPYSFKDGDTEYILPEVAGHSAPFVLQHPFVDESRHVLEGLADLRLVDSSLVRHDGYYYLFSGHADSVADCLHLYVSNEMKGPYARHPHSPIVIDPECARMGGRLSLVGGKMYRFGQNNCFGYGDRITVSEIVELTPTRYAERKVGHIAFDDARGPHTLDIQNGSAVLDFYIDRFSLMAGYRRLAAKVFD
jgi:hypothetical protein